MRLYDVADVARLALLFCAIALIGAGVRTGGPTAGSRPAAIGSVSSAAWKQRVIYRFGTRYTDGSAPLGVTSDARGDLFGVTVYGGLNNDGTIFELVRPATGSSVWKNVTLHSFGDWGDGVRPAGTLIADGHGTLYGLTQGDNGRGNGTVFALVPNGAGWKEYVLSLLSG
jgi:uncharacterized repeat protein (TIGR03803 family)